MSDIISLLNDLVWSPVLVYLCLGVGVFFTIRTKAIQIRRIGDIFVYMFTGKGSASGVSSFQSLAVSLSGRVGTGNIAGVATAIALGGPGAVFWMWAVALLGASTSFVESTLGQIYKERDRDTGEYRGGPAYYLAKAYAHTKAKGLFELYGAVFACVAIFAMSSLLPGVQANGISSAMANAWGLEPWIPAVGIVIVLGFIIIGGIKRIANFASIVVPFMAVIYIIGALVVVIINAGAIPEVISLIFSSAFGVNAAFGAVIGEAVAWGVKRGIYSNEAGQGTGPHAAAASEVSHPAKQGLVQAGAVYIDTLLVCSATAFMILSTGMYRVYEGEDGGPLVGEGGRLPEGVEAGPGYVQNSFDTIVPGLGASFIAISLAFFAFTTIVAYYYMAETNLSYLLRNSRNTLLRSVLMRLLQLAILVAVVIGAVGGAGDAWTLGDIGVGLMAWLNIIGILIIQGPAFKILKDFEAQRKAGKDPVYIPETCPIPGAEHWESGLHIEAHEEATGQKIDRRTGDLLDLPRP
ncbi:alanine/glycine:cation symporter family protein [Brevibacterium sp. UBA7493]|uniref:alanine/glycine:cation symporter family protein n=1 Tax=Brevibacterium sp. UBA7493 TaxID=1946121 RepID=UPI0025796037|nr:alanine/glycine:cation symporter family protein [Brevibacterium sp. UBA7493]